MNPLKYSCLLMLIGGVLAGQAQAHTPPGSPVLLAQNTPITNTPPANDAIRRINPNSRQGSTSSAPPVRGATTLPTPPVPSLENGQIRNGYPRPTTPPATLKPTAPSLQRQNTR